MIQYYFLMFEILRFQANRILRQKIVEDQFLDLVSVETEVRSVYKELYRCILSLYFLCRLRILHLLYRSFACLCLC